MSLFSVMDIGLRLSRGDTLGILALAFYKPDYFAGLAFQMNAYVLVCAQNRNKFDRRDYHHRATKGGQHERLF